MEKEVVDTQLIAHDKEVYDIAWGGVGLFASVSGKQPSILKIIFAW